MTPESCWSQAGFAWWQTDESNERRAPGEYVQFFPLGRHRRISCCKSISAVPSLQLDSSLLSYSDALNCLCGKSRPAVLRGNSCLSSGGTFSACWGGGKWGTGARTPGSCWQTMCSSPLSSLSSPLSCKFKCRLNECHCGRKPFFHLTPQWQLLFWIVHVPVASLFWFLCWFQFLCQEHLLQCFRNPLQKSCLCIAMQY